MAKKIIHVDMDCFYAAVAVRDNPELAGKPVAVGGAKDRRGVIATCNYEARAYGVRSAMATAQALKLCPHLILAKGDMNLYKSISQQVRAIFQQYTDKIEPLSLDEAYLDVSDCQAFNGSATLIAQAIREEIYQQTQLTASAGVAPNKFIAKIASDENKPNGICVVPPDKVTDFVAALPLRKIPGVGKVTAKKLANMGLETTADVRVFSQKELIDRFGKFAYALIERSHGIDDRELCLHRDRKSIGVEHTLAQDIFSEREIQQVIEPLFDELCKRIDAKKQSKHIKKQVLKLKFNDFQSTTIEKTVSELKKSHFMALLQAVLSRQKGRSIRLVGLSVGLTDSDITEQQLSFSF
ncbi:DNA polymerase IV [Catenovulum sp. SM1970]|uniref:DNA polymerase IV n=1 Tax=Marinifaba aquimaris TaxID=2741323 RepID=UPI001574AFAE|nr:DNA polymerase IV [Marinifaba aquimaris]NTS78304.1 DNA polymerase IV [Marinifaba aquimaris]